GITRLRKRSVSCFLPRGQKRSRKSHERGTNDYFASCDLVDRFIIARRYLKKQFSMKRSGIADLPLHGGRVPPWLAERMTRLGTAITETIIQDYGTSAFLSRLSDPFWFQALGAVMGMDWHSSGITTSVMGALKRGLAPRAHELGIFVCGGRGRHSRNTPHELLQIAERRGF